MNEWPKLSALLPKTNEDGDEAPWTLERRDKYEADLLLAGNSTDHVFPSWLLDLIERNLP